MIAYITDLQHQPSGGGSYAVNWHAQEQLGRHFELAAPAPIVPQPSRWESTISRASRQLLKRPGRFAYFSERTLADNAKRVHAAIPHDAKAVFFRAATRWCQATPDIPYFVYLDVVFHTFYQNTFQPDEFKQSDLNRIWKQEAQFLEQAQGVFFESQWGLDRAREAYGLQGNHYEAVGRGGVLEPPEQDQWDGDSLDLVTIAMNFHQKGGDWVAEAFKLLKAQHPKLRWHIIGGAPPDEVMQTNSDIIFHGKLRPDDPNELKRFRELLANAFLLLHPTREDTNPLVITEAAYFGCPTISVRKFGIPELILDGNTGTLLDPAVTPQALADAIERLIVNRDDYRQMRQHAREFALKNGSWEAIGQRMADVIQPFLKA